VPLGVAAILRQPDDRPARRKKSPAPLQQAATQVRAQGLLGSLCHLRGCIPRRRRPMARRRSVGKIPDWIISSRPTSVRPMPSVLRDRGRRSSTHDPQPVKAMRSRGAEGTSVPPDDLEEWSGESFTPDQTNYAVRHSVSE
jgi:hypothetical protein